MYQKMKVIIRFDSTSNSLYARMQSELGRKPTNQELSARANQTRNEALAIAI